jgi:hypothetical protein
MSHDNHLLAEIIAPDRDQRAGTLVDSRAAHHQRSARITQGSPRLEALEDVEQATVSGQVLMDSARLCLQQAAGDLTAADPNTPRLFLSSGQMVADALDLVEVAGQ